MKYEIRLAGEGGQGLILGGIILAEAAGIYEGKNVVQSQLYGAATRGELSKSEVIISDTEIHYVKVRMADVLLCLTQDSYNEYKNFVKDNGKIIIDPFYVKEYVQDDKRIYPLGLSQRAIDVTGREITTNMVSLGAISGLTGIVGLDALKKAVLERVNPAFADMNISALEAGYALGKETE